MTNCLHPRREGPYDNGVEFCLVCGLTVFPNDTIVAQCQRAERDKRNAKARAERALRPRRV